MTEDAYINQVIKDNPAIMAANKIQLTPAALREALRAAWRAGRDSKPTIQVESIFGRVFGEPWKQ